MAQKLKPNILCIAPPYLSMGAPPLGSASLLAYLRANGCDDFDFLDLRLWTSNSYSPTYRPTGAFGETYVIDVPDLPLVLGLLRGFDSGSSLVPPHDRLFETYSLERGINSAKLHIYLKYLDRLFAWAFSQLRDLEFIGFTVWSSNLLTTLLAAAHLKRRRRPPLIVLGGPQVTESEASAKLALRSGLADAVALGEGEETLLRLYEAFRLQREIPPGIPGIMRFDRTSGTFEKSEGQLLRLPELPAPAFDKMPLLSYQLKGSERAITYELSRGCTDKCTFCSQWVFWRRMRINEVTRSVEGVQELIGRYKAGRIWFMDSLLNASLDRLRQFAEEVIHRKLKFKWGGFMRANVDRETAHLLRAAGCDFAFIGVESLSDETLTLMRKRRTEAQNIVALRNLLDAGFRRVVAGFIPGFPGDTRERFFQTALALRGIYRAYPDSFRVNIEPFFLAPGQPMFQQLESCGLHPQRWSDDYLAIAPAYRDITNEIYCHVEGSNQGLNRLGELTIAEVITEDEDEQFEEELLYYSDPVELPIDRLQIDPLQSFGCFGRLKTETAQVYGLILSPDERDQYELLALRNRVPSPDGYPVPLLQKEEVAEFLRIVENRHVVPPRNGSARIIRDAYSTELLPGDSLMLSPFVVARQITSDSEACIMLVNVSNREEYSLAAEWQTVLSRLVKQPISVSQVSSLLRKEEKIILTQLEALLERGVLLTCGPG